MKGVLRHISKIPDGHFGVLLLNDIPFALTLERTYTLADGSQAVKIPPGVYRCTKTIYHKKGYATFEIHVPGHSRILFHIGNLETDSDGCVLVGEEFGELNGKPAILSSGRGFKEFMDKFGHLDYFDLTVEL